MRGYFLDTLNTYIFKGIVLIMLYLSMCGLSCKAQSQNPSIENIVVEQYKKNNSVKIKYEIINTKKNALFKVDMKVTKNNEKNIALNKGNLFGDVGLIRCKNKSHVIMWKNPAGVADSVNIELTLYKIPRLNVFCPDCPSKYKQTLLKDKNKYYFKFPAITVLTASLLAMGIGSNIKYNNYVKNNAIHDANTLSYYRSTSKIGYIGASTLWIANLSTHLISRYLNFKAIRYKNIPKYIH